MKKIYIKIILFLVLFSSVSVFAQTKTYEIGVIVWDKNIYYENALNGILKGIELSGLPVNLNIKQVDSDEIETKRILANWQNENIDLICAIGTKSAIIAIEEIHNIPIVFTAVTNPVVSGISKSWNGSGRNITGSSNWVNSEIMLKTFKKTIPHLKNLGVIFDPDNPVPVAEITEAQKICESLGISLKQAHIKSKEQIENSIEDLISRDIDALWVPLEILVFENMDRVGKTTQPQKLPVVSSTVQGVGLDESVDNMVGIVAVTIDFYALGRLCVPAIIEILTKGVNPSDISIKTMSDYQIIINKNAADKIDYDIPMAILAEASTVIKGLTGQKIVIAGTGDSQELLRTLAGILEDRLGGGKVEVPDSIGSSGGIRALINNEVDIARVARPLKKEEQDAGLNYRLFAEAPVVFAVHPDVIGIENITTEEIIKIYSGQLRNWNEFGYQVGKIYPINRESGDSCLKVLLAKVPGFADISEPVGKIFYSTQDAVDAISEHEQTIGFLPLPSTIGTNIRVLKVDGIYPSVENVQSGKYKLAVPLAVVCKGKPKGLAKEFVDFLYSQEAQKIIIASGSVPVKTDNQE